MWRHVKVYVLRCLSSPGFDSDISLLLLPPARKSIEYFAKILNFSINGVIHFLFPRYFCSLEVFLKEFSPKLKETHVQTEPLTGLKGFFFFFNKKKKKALISFCVFVHFLDRKTAEEIEPYIWFQIHQLTTSMFIFLHILIVVPSFLSCMIKGPFVSSLVLSSPLNPSSHCGGTPAVCLVWFQVSTQLQDREDCPHAVISWLDLSVWKSL